MRRVDTERNEAVVSLHRAGKCSSEIQAEMGLTKWQVNGILRRAGERLNPEPKRKASKKRQNGAIRPIKKIMERKRVCLDGSPGQEPVGCLYIAKEITEPGWTYCQAKKQEGSPYCVEHHKVCYRSLPLKIQEAA